MSYKEAKPRQRVAQTTQSDFDIRVLVEKAFSPELSGFLLTDHHKLIAENAKLKDDLNIWNAQFEDDQKEISELKRSCKELCEIINARTLENERLKGVIQGMKDYLNG